MSELILADLVDIAFRLGSLICRGDLSGIHVVCNRARTHRILFLKLSKLKVGLSVAKVFYSATDRSVCASQIHADGSSASDPATSWLRHRHSTGVLVRLWLLSLILLMLTCESFLLHVKSPHGILQDW